MAVVKCVDWVSTLVHGRAPYQACQVWEIPSGHALVHCHAIVNLVIDLVKVKHRMKYVQV